MTPADDVRKPTLAEQIEACERIANAMVDRRCGFVRLVGARHTHNSLKAAAATLREVQKQRTPYPEFCRHPDKCEGLGCCPRDPTCAD